VRDYLARTYYAQTERIASSAALTDAVQTLGGMARYDGAEHQYTSKLRLDARANPDLGASIRTELGSRLRHRHRDRDQITPVLEQSSRLPGIVGREVPGRVVEWFAEQVLPIARLINGRLGQV
jgi:hypothetical protein